MTPRRALRRSLCRAAELGLNLPLSVTGIEEEDLDRDTLLAGVAEGGLIVLLESEESAAGLFILDLQLLAALVEVQTLGRASEHEVAPRSVTRTDAAVALPLIDGTLAGFDQLMSEAEGPRGFKGFHFSTWVKDRRTLAAQFPDGMYTCFQIVVSIGAGNRSGQLLLALPIVEPPAESPESTRNLATVRDEALEAPARLDTVLHRIEMRLEEVGALKPGDRLAVPLRALGEVTLHTGDRTTVATGILGQYEGSRAVRLTGFGPPRTAASAVASYALPRLNEIDLADPSLIETPRPRKSDPTPPRPPQQTKPTQFDVPMPAKSAQEKAPERADPTGTEALLSELGLSDLGTDLTQLPPPAPLEPPERETGSFMADFPDKGAAGPDR